ncbi:nitroreductase [Actinomycetospora corticicola]|uniref:Nitroreductase n=1 Tax=Actinomycetospora corticicola TaxID=663602 RepID=A0A7Y9DXW6_9PSEU|nr:nitroreductase [Actinomycetospora corticicola]
MTLAQRTAAPAAPASSVSEALRSRRSVRAFRPTPVPRELVEELLALASRSASNSNTQPWRVHVVTGDAKRRLAEDLWEALDAGHRHPQPGYTYQPAPEAWVEPFRSRRAAFGDQLYRQCLGVEHDDAEGRDCHHRRNYEFFGAPVGMILTVSAHPLDGALVDAGQFLQGLMLAAREAGLDTCAQASFIDFHRVLRRHLDIGDDQIVVCGVALGYADHEHPLDEVVTPREAVSAFATFHGDGGS